MYFLLLFITLIFCQDSEDRLDLKNYAWRHRVVCISAENKEKILPLLHDLSINNIGLEERKLIVFLKINGEYYKGINLQRVGSVINFPSSNTKFSLHLIGLDGGIKNEWNYEVSVQTIFNTIDAMPMRINETNKY